MFTNTIGNVICYIHKVRWSYSLNKPDSSNSTGFVASMAALQITTTNINNNWQQLTAIANKPNQNYNEEKVEKNEKEEEKEGERHRERDVLRCHSLLFSLFNGLKNRLRIFSFPSQNQSVNLSCLKSNIQIKFITDANTTTQNNTIHRDIKIHQEKAIRQNHVT